MGADTGNGVDAREARVAAMLRVLPDAIFELDRQLCYVDVHSGDIELLVRREEIIGRPVSEVLAPFPHLVELTENLVSRAFDGQDGTGEYALELPDGQHFYEARAARIDAARVVIVVREVTEARRLLGQLIVADRQRTASALTAALIHELGNPLAYLLTALDALAHKVQGNRGARELADIAADGARQLAQITSDFRALARSDDTTKSALLGKTLQRALRFAAPTLGPTRVTVDVPEGILVAIPEGRLGQVLLNLFANAAHAIEGRPQARLEIKAEPAATMVRVLVVDQGAGIAPEHMGSIFDPFFTTKADGAGTGLGLWMVRRIVEEHGGRITCLSTFGEGTTFELELPLS